MVAGGTRQSPAVGRIGIAHRGAGRCLWLGAAAGWAWGGARELLAGSRTRRQTVVAGASPGAGPYRRALTAAVISDTIDAVLLPHTLEFAADPYSIVREVDRVLAGEGQLIVLGFRPWSLWGLRARSSRSDFPPGMRRCSRRAACRNGSSLGFDVARRALPVRSPWSRIRPERGRRALRRGLTRCPPGPICSRRASACTPSRPCGCAFARSPCPRRLVKPTRVRSREPVEIYTDGACRGNPGPGGWAALLDGGRSAK